MSRQARSDLHVSNFFIIIVRHSFKAKNIMLAITFIFFLYTSTVKATVKVNG